GGGSGLVIGDARRAIPFRKVIDSAHPSSWVHPTHEGEMAHARGPRRGRRRLSIVNEGAAGLDVGAMFHVVAIPADRAAGPVRTFQSLTAVLRAVADWPESVGVRTNAMESTGVYWIPVYEILEQRGFEVLLVNARDTRNVPGPNTRAPRPLP